MFRNFDRQIRAFPLTILLNRVDCAFVFNHLQQHCCFWAPTRLQGTATNFVRRKTAGARRDRALHSEERSWHTTWRKTDRVVSKDSRVVSLDSKAVSPGSAGRASKAASLDRQRKRAGKVRIRKKMTASGALHKS